MISETKKFPFYHQEPARPGDLSTQSDEGDWLPPPRVRLPKALKRLARHTRFSPENMRYLMATLPKELLIIDFKDIWKELRQSRRPSRVNGLTIPSSTREL